ncbi:hypothetical protein chiPu_0006879 [Chiloscyllium punctatum]|uniref:Uncharacterized protein n=1 Tax=Chiloscyllium punctatum TaxID=137246 RepID=A0A401SDG8_CHIPU|nr:hypothetical protein [Chiloscyllium punctatum]
MATGDAQRLAAIGWRRAVPPASTAEPEYPELSWALGFQCAILKAHPGDSRGDFGVSGTMPALPKSGSP